MSGGAAREPVPRLRPWQGPAVLAYGFRPFFLLAAVDAAVTIAVWMICLFGGTALPSLFDPLAWHVHETLFGFATAAICGFLLTAVPNWTGRLPLNGVPLLTLVLLWLVGRLAVLTSAWHGLAVALAIDVAFPVALSVVVARELIAGRNRRNAPVFVAVAVLAAINALMHLEAVGMIATAGAAQRAAIGVVVMLIALIGGRIVPSFTRNWLAKRRPERLPASFDRLDQAALAAAALALVLWSVRPTDIWTALAAAAAALLHGVRLARWQGHRTVVDPLLLVLHVAYAWVPVGFVLIAVPTVVAALPPIMAIHAFGVGAMGTMILAVMTRATLGHTGRPLKAGTGTSALYVLVTTAAVARVAASAVRPAYETLLAIAAFGWVAAFVVFVAVYGPMLWRPRVDGRPG